MVQQDHWPSVFPYALEPPLEPNEHDAPASSQEHGANPFPPQKGQTPLTEDAS